MPTVNAFIAKKKLTGQDLLAFKYALDVNLQHEYGSPLAELALWFDEDSERSGGDKLVTGGYANMVQYLAKGVNVKLSTEVSRQECMCWSCMGASIHHCDFPRVKDPRLCAFLPPLPP